jgi:hypothetical protein
MARGLVQNARCVEPVRFSGERLPLPAMAPVPGHGPVRVELDVLVVWSAKNLGILRSR